MNLELTPHQIELLDQLVFDRLIRLGGLLSTETVLEYRQIQQILRNAQEAMK